MAGSVAQTGDFLGGSGSIFDYDPVAPTQTAAQLAAVRAGTAARDERTRLASIPYGTDANGFNPVAGQQAGPGTAQQWQVTQQAPHGPSRANIFGEYQNENLFPGQGTATTATAIGPDGKPLGPTSANSDGPIATGLNGTNGGGNAAGAFYNLPSDLTSPGRFDYSGASAYAPAINGVAGAGGFAGGVNGQVQTARNTGAGFLDQGAAGLADATAMRNSLLGQAKDFSATAGQVAGNGFDVGARGAPVANVNPSQLGAVSNVGGRLGATPQSAMPRNVAGALGAAPRVGNVANVQGVGAAPGAVMGQAGTMGQSNADQAGMLSRVNQFLDQGNGPSMAEAQLQQAQAGNMANIIGAARSGRGGAGSQAQALRGAMSEGSAVMSDTAGQLATLRAQEEDMLKNRQLNAIGVGGQMATAQRGQDLGYRGQDIGQLQGDQATALGARGQDITTGMANQNTQLSLEQLRGQLGLGARGQNLSALQGDQATQAQVGLGNAQIGLGARGQNLSALQGDQSSQLGMRGQNLSALQGNQGTALGARSQDIAARGQDLNALQTDADRALAAQQLQLQGLTGLSGLALQSQGQGLQYSGQMGALGLAGEGMAQDAMNNARNNDTSLHGIDTAAETQLQMQQRAIDAQPGFWEQMAGNVLGAGLNYGTAGLMGSIFDRGGAPAAPADNTLPYRTAPY
jgi:hypothetical protein